MVTRDSGRRDELHGRVIIVDDNVLYISKQLEEGILGTTRNDKCLR